MERPSGKDNGDGKNGVRVPRRPVGPEGKASRRSRLFALQRGLSAPDALEATQFVQERPQLAAAKSSPKHRRLPKGKRRLPYLSASRRMVSPAAVQPPVWKSLGPTSIPDGQTYGTGGNHRIGASGRVAGVAVDPTDPQHILVASAGGGIWQTWDDGTTWSPQTDFEASLSMGAIAFAPSDPRRVYAGTGEGDSNSRLGVGLLRSLDGGTTWRLLRSTFLSGFGVFDIAVDPNDPLHVFVATGVIDYDTFTAFGHLLESTNGGEKWEARRNELTWDISINPTDPMEVFAASYDGLFKSSNGGTSWQPEPFVQRQVNAFERIEVCHAPSNPNIVYVFAAYYDGSWRYRGGVWRRSKARGAFVRQALPPKLELKQASYDWCAAVDPSDENVLYVGAIHVHKGVRSSNTQWEWENISSRDSGDSIHPDQHHITFSPADSKTVYIANDGGLYRSPNGGTQWTSLNEGLAITEFEYIAQHPDNLTWIIGGTQDNGTLRLKGNGVWETIADGDGGDCGVNELVPNVCFHSYYDMGLEVSESSGDRTSWDWVGPGSVEIPSLFYPPLESRHGIVVQGGAIVVIAQMNQLSAIESGRILWPTVHLPQPDYPILQYCTAIWIRNEQEILVGTQFGNIYRIVNEFGWREAKLVATPRKDAYVSDIYVDANQPGWIWVTYSTINAGHVFLSKDNGARWANKSADLPNIPVNAIVADVQDHRIVYVGTDNGVYRTIDSAITWNDFSNGLPYAIIGDLLFHEKHRVLRAATRSRGIWEVTV